jgi:hypothetical protein
MKIAWLISAALASCSFAAEAQVPYIVGLWKLDAAASRLPGPAPQTHVRRYSLAADGTLVGLAVVVDAQGRPNFLQFAANSDGKDYAEFDSASLARFQIDGTKGPRTYAETPMDSHTVAWTDKFEGRVIASGRKWVSEDGQTLSFTSESTNDKGESVTYLFVFAKQPEPARR